MLRNLSICLYAKELEYFVKSYVTQVFVQELRNLSIFPRVKELEY